MTVIPGEEIVSQHHLLLMDMVLKKKVRRKVKFRKKLKLRRLTKSEVKEKFAERVNNICDGNEDSYGLKRKLLDVASEIWDYTKGKPKYSETWWWNKNVDVAVCRKRELKKDAKRAVYTAMDQKAREAVEKVIRVKMVMSCLELPNKGLGRRKMSLWLLVLKMKVGR